MTKILTQEEKATIVKLIGLNFVKEEDEIAVVLEKNSNLITPYTYKSLATVIIAKLNNLTNQSIYRLRKVLKSKSPSANKLKIIDILQLSQYLKYASIN
jgi:hypothetical protein